MRIARFSLPDGAADAGVPRFGLVEGDLEQDGGPEQYEAMVIAELAGHPFTPEPQTTGRVWPLADVRLLAPVLPSKIVAVGRNYADHAKEMGNEVPAVPLTFLKPSTSVIGPNETIGYPSFSQDVHHEAELAIVIGRLCSQVPRERAREVVLGYTCANDVTARDAQKAEGQWARAKGFDTSCPLGPWIETDVEPDDLAVTCTLNDELKQAGRTSEMLRGIDELIAFITEAMTLLPGDVILTGTPAGVGPMRVGDLVSVSIEGIGTLTNRIVKR